MVQINGHHAAFFVIRERGVGILPANSYLQEIGGEKPTPSKGNPKFNAEVGVSNQEQVR